MASGLTVGADMDRRAYPARRRGSRRSPASPSRWRPTPAGRWRFLADAGVVLDATLDYEQTLASTARLAVPEVADYCLVVLVAEDGTIRWADSAHRDPEQERLLDTLRGHATLAYRPDHPVLLALRTGQAQLVPFVGRRLGDWWKASHLAVIQALSTTSCIAVPLIARGRTLGALFFAVTSRSGRRYSPRDLELAHDVARRAASAIDHALLFRAAERAAASRDELMAVVAHDLTNPLNTIKLSLSRLFEEIVPDDAEHRRAREGLGTVARATERMQRLIHDLLDLSSADAGRLVIRPAPIDPAKLVDDAVEAHLTLASAKGIALEACVDPHLPTVLADGDRIAQVFSNLIGNALKFTPTGGRVSVAGSPADDCVRFVVQDTGPGIAAEDRARVFDRFWQAGRKARSGTGLGLSIAKAIVEGHRGRIGVDSTPGVGTRFSFCLPRAANTIEVARHWPGGVAKKHPIV